MTNNPPQNSARGASTVFTQKCLKVTNKVNCEYRDLGREELGGHDQHHPLAAKRCFKRSGMIRALKMMIRDEALALKLTSDLQQRLFHALQAEHLDVGFMLSGFRRRHKVSQRPVCVQS